MSDNTQKDNEKNIIKDIYKYDSSSPDDLPRVEDGNEKLLTDQEALYQYFFSAVQEIIKQDKIVYNGFSDPKKTGAIISYNQFKYILQRLNDLYIKPNQALIKDNHNKWDFIKVERLYNVYLKLCSYYNFNCTADPFFELFIHIDKEILITALTSRRSNILIKAFENARSGLFSEMENSTIPLHKLAIANSRYKLPEIEKPLQTENTAAALPDLSGYLPPVERDKMEIEPETDTI